MWTRAQLKDNAKSGLRRYYWQALLVCIIAALLGAGTGAVKMNSNRTENHTRQGMNVSIGGPVFSVTYGEDGGLENGRTEGRLWIDSPLYSTSVPMSRERMASIWMIMTVAVIVALLVVVAFSILVSNVVGVGKCSYFMKQTAGVTDTGIRELFSPFTTRYGNVVAVMFMRDLQIFLWSLLLVIPGIIKSYEYYMVPYLLAEDPDMTWEDAKFLSRRMMDGNKLAVWILGLSFIGWDIAGALLCGVGQIFVAPYKEAVYGELYHTLRNNTMRDTYGRNSGYEV